MSRLCVYDLVVSTILNSELFLDGLVGRLRTSVSPDLFEPVEKPP